MRHLKTEKNAVNFLLSLPPKQFKQIQSAIYRLMSNPEQHDSKPLRGAEFLGLWRNDMGEYRIVYRFDDETVWVIAIGKRNDDDIYKQLKRKMG